MIMQGASGEERLQLVFALGLCGFLMFSESLTLQQMQLSDSWCTGRESCSQTVELHQQVRHLRHVCVLRGGQSGTQVSFPEVTRISRKQVGLDVKEGIVS